jgi:hypothetical protein
MIKFQFTARCGEESLPLEVNIEYRPGKQMQRARRTAVGELLAALEIDRASVDATGNDMVTVTTDGGTWVIAEGRGGGQRRGGL